MTLACAALLVADTWPRTAGVALGLALLKPHIAGPVALWMPGDPPHPRAPRRDCRLAIGWGVYDARIAESPLTTAVGLWRVVRAEYGGAAGLVGHTSVRAFAQLMSADLVVADRIWLAWAALLLLAAGAVALRHRSRPLSEGGMAVPALFCLWSLLVTYHNGNNLLLMLPAFAFLWFPAIGGPQRGTGCRSSGYRRR